MLKKMGTSWTWNPGDPIPNCVRSTVFRCKLPMGILFWAPWSGRDIGSMPLRHCFTVCQVPKKLDKTCFKTWNKIGHLFLLALTRFCICFNSHLEGFSFCIPKTASNRSTFEAQASSASRWSVLQYSAERVTGRAVQTGPFVSAVFQPCCTSK